MDAGLSAAKLGRKYILFLVHAKFGATMCVVEKKRTNHVLVPVTSAAVVTKVFIFRPSSTEAGLRTRSSCSVIPVSKRSSPTQSIPSLSHTENDGSIGHVLRFLTETSVGTCSTYPFSPSHNNAANKNTQRNSPRMSTNAHHSGIDMQVAMGALNVLPFADGSNGQAATPLAPAKPPQDTRPLSRL